MSISNWFSGLSSLTTVNIPASVTSIGDGAFVNCTGLTSIIIPNSVTSIGEEAFWNCRNLTSITIGTGVTTIGRYAFVDCTGLTSITIPASVTSIGESAFWGCTGLTSITGLPTTPPPLGGSSEFVFYDTHANLAIKVPSASVTAYQTATNWSEYASRISAIN
jgi:hypothetical protein